MQYAMSPLLLPPVSLPSSTSAPRSAVDHALGQVARAAAADGCDLDTFMKAAWHAYLDARPGLRDHLEARALTAQLRELRARGRLGQA